MQKRRRPKAGLIIFFLVLVVIALGVYGGFSREGRLFGAASSNSPTESIGTLRTQLNNIAASYPNDTVSISLVNIANNKQYNFGSTQVMPGASTTKVITAIDYLHQVELGNASLSQDLEGSGETAQLLMQQMIQETSITNSDNAWYDFLNDLGFNQITSYGKSIGLKSFNSYNNTLTASDEAVTLQKLFEGKLINKAHTQLMYSFMQHTGNDDLIPAAVPAGATVYNKYGYLYGYLHDAAIVTYKGHSFVLVIYTNNSSGNLNDYSSRVQLFHSLTKAVIKYYNSYA